MENNKLTNKEEVEASSKKETPAVSNEKSSQSENNLPPMPEAESKDEKEKVQTKNQTLNPTVDFSSIFNVASEEEPVDKPKLAKTSQPKADIAPKVEVPTEPVEGPKEPPKFNKELFNNEEKILYEIKPEKDGNPIVVFFFFLFLIAFILFLPSLVKVAKFDRNILPDEQTKPQEEQNESYELGSTAVRVAIDNLELNNFTTSKRDNNYNLIFTLTNTSSQPYMFDKKLYVVLYDNEQISGYALIHSFDILQAYGAREVILTINENAFIRSNHFKIEEISPSRYPNVTTTETDGDYNVLTCNYLNDEMKYYFSNNSLVKIKETYHEELSNSNNYTANKDLYHQTSEQYKQIDNFSSTFVETNTDFTMLNEIELRDIPDKTLNDLKVYKFFKYSENINTVNFELEAQGYNCG